jgi:hypothetical protein
MTEIMKAGSPAVVSVLMLGGNRIDDVPAGEDIASGDACHIDGDGMVHRSIGGTLGALADVRGFAAAAAARGEPVTLVFDVAMRYGEGLPRDASLYLSGMVPGGLTDAPSPGATQQVAYVVDATHIHVLQSYDEPAAGPAVGRKGPR